MIFPSFFNIVQCGNDDSPHVPSTKDLIGVARRLTSDWKMFVRSLDVPESEIEAIVEQFKYEPREQKYQCLCYWLNDKADQASFEQLIDEAKNSGQVKVVKFIESILRGALCTGGCVVSCVSFVVCSYVSHDRDTGCSKGNSPVIGFFHISAQFWYYIILIPMCL